tara:strand:+ start:511 stop:1086 length:576 start_codon:yes stop_codon:yes gene_type:complete
MLLKEFIKIFRNIVCSVGLMIIFPVLFLAALIIFLEDGMPVFFIQERIGKNKLSFKIIKMRTLKIEAPDTGTHELDQKYQLICGKLLRKIKLDEFPQLINVIKGDLNLIGPRPGLINQTKLTECRSKNNVYAIKPGITGLSQILGYDMSDPMKLAEVDKLYIDNKSLFIDLLIMVGTFVEYPKKYLIKLIT